MDDVKYLAVFVINTVSNRINSYRYSNVGYCY